MRIEDTPIDRSTQDNNILYLYDNFFSGSSENYLSKKKGSFIFADQIKINIPMNILIQDSIYPENSIDRMMLANLRAKKLFDEYSELQKRARSVLQDNGVSGEKNDGKKNSSHMAENLNIDEKNEAIRKTMAHVNFLGHLSKDTDPEQNPMILEHLSTTDSEINTSEKNISYTRSSEGIGDKGGGHRPTDPFKERKPGAALDFKCIIKTLKLYRQQQAGNYALHDFHDPDCFFDFT